jgi:hypothetical protein
MKHFLCYKRNFRSNIFLWYKRNGLMFMLWNYMNRDAVSFCIEVVDRHWSAFVYSLCEIQNNEVSNVENVIIIQRVNAKSSGRQHVPLTNVKVGSGAMKEWEFSAERSLSPCVLVEIRYTGLPIVKTKLETSV